METPQANPDMQQILSESKSRWLRPGEVCEILRNYHMFNITPDPPYMPLGGSLFLFDRKALRYFRKDGYQWKKKKDGKTVREAHEKLKCGNVDVLHCYYAHGEDNENFQRRCYWLLDGQLEHIVLVHYRDVNEEASSSTPELSSTGPTFQSDQTSSVACSAHIDFSTFVNPTSSNAEIQTASSEFKDADSGDDLNGAQLAVSVLGSEFQIASLPGNSISEPFSVLRSSTFQPYTARSMNTVSLNRSVNPFSLNEVTSQNLILDEGQNAHGTSPAAGSFGFQLNNDNSPSSDFHSSEQKLIDNKEQKLVLTGSFGFQFNNDNSRSSEFHSSEQKLTDNEEQKLVQTGSSGFQFNNDNSPSSEFHCSEQKFTDNEEHKFLFQRPSCTDPLKTRTVDYIAQIDEGSKFRLHDGITVLPEPHSQSLTIDDIIQVEEENAEVADHRGAKDNVSNASIQTHNMSQMYQDDFAPPSDSSERAEEVPSVFKSSLGTDIYDNEPGYLEKIDNFGGWMNEELGYGCNDSLMASDSFFYWNAFDIQNDKVFSTMSRHFEIDADSMLPFLSQEQLFSIDDFSPDWAYSGTETKVLISGVFLGGIQPSRIKWCCMFGEVEVSAEVLTTNAIRCQAPPHSPGRVPFYITCNNRLACSEVREFEYRENPPSTAILESLKAESEDEMYLQFRFAKILFLGSDKKRLLCSIENCAKCIIMKSLSHMLIYEEPEWEKIEEEIKTCEGYLWNLRDALLEKLLKGKLHEWLVCKLHEDGNGLNILDDRGQGAIHLAAALGYEWAVTSIIATGVNPNFRDARGRTALHWAAYYGREQTIVTLMKLGASPGAIEDPTSKFPVGQTAADLASSSGHKGIAAYLAEADLIDHLNSMSISENVMESVSASLAAEEAVETLEVQNINTSYVETGQISLRESLAAVRNSAQAAARIHAAFRAQSFRQRQLTKNAKISDSACEVMLHPSPNKIHKIGHFNEYLHTSAIKIQQMYRGWRIHKEFLKIRDRIVKIQAHVRGHQVRKHYKKIVWSVGIVEKAILRWRRKRPGLRGFRAAKTIGCAEQEFEKADEYDFLHVGRKQKEAGFEKALARVKSMVRYQEAREQYRRLMESSSKSKVRSVNSSSDQLNRSNEENLMEEHPSAS